MWLAGVKGVWLPLVYVPAFVLGAFRVVAIAGGSGTDGARFTRVLDWLDRAEGPLPNPETEYPQLKRAAAFACTDGACSTPVYEASQVSVAVRNALAFK